MSSPGPSSAAESFSPEGAREREVFEFSTTGKRWALGFGFAFAVLLPALALLHDPLGYTVTCDPAQRACTVVEHHVGNDVSTELPFENIKSVRLGDERQSSNTRSGRTRRYSTGRAYLDFMDQRGVEVDASVAADPSVLRRDELEALIFEGKGERMVIETSLSVRDMSGVLGFFLVGLFFVALTRWRTVVELEPSTGVLEVKTTRWPVLTRTTLTARGQDIESVEVKGSDFLFTVRAKLKGGDVVTVARFGTGPRAHDVAGAIRGFSRRMKKALD